MADKPKKTKASKVKTNKSPVLTKQKIKKFEKHSMLHQALMLAHQISAKGIQWRRPYAKPQTHIIRTEASVWIDLYPESIMTRRTETFLDVLAEEELWQIFQKIGISAMHTNPLSEAGGINMQGKKIPSVDGGFDRADYNIARIFGGNEKYRKLVEVAAKYGCYIAGDIVPCHTGKNADFRLAELHYKNYPGLYTMVEIAPEDWYLLPEVKGDEDTVNLSKQTVAILKDKGYIDGEFPEVLFAEPGIKESNWSATPIINCVDKVQRRWVYLHFFKSGQPALNWLDPTLGAQRITFGDIIKHRVDFGVKILRIDANSLLAHESIPENEIGISRGHPTSLISTYQIAMFMRKLGGWTFEENVVSLDSLKKAAQYGTELSYDFTTRAGYAHAFLTGNANLLNLQLKLLHEYEIDPGRLIHALQNHDCLNYELPHFWRHYDDIFEYEGKKLSGKELEKQILLEVAAACKKLKLAYSYAYNGPATTFASIAAARLGISAKDCSKKENKTKIQQMLMPILIYNAMQSGIFQVSGWDLVGAMNLSKQQVKELIKDGDIRWIERGAYDLTGNRSRLKNLRGKVPRAPMLFGSVPEQLEDPESFVSVLSKILYLRKIWKFADAEQITALPRKGIGVVMLLHRLPDEVGISITAVNFSLDKASNEKINFREIQNIKKAEIENKEAIDILTDKVINRCMTFDELKINLPPLGVKVIVIKPVSEKNREAVPGTPPLTK